MMDMVLDAASWILLLTGGFFYLVGAIGLVRMPDVFTRMHAVSVSETLGAGLLLAGMMLQGGWSLATLKLVIILALMLLTGPVSTHALSRAAMHDGVKPRLHDGEEGS